MFFCHFGMHGIIGQYSLRPFNGHFGILFLWSTSLNSEFIHRIDKNFFPSAGTIGKTRMRVNGKEAQRGNRLIDS